jgi:hypothetical protein
MPRGVQLKEQRYFAAVLRVQLTRRSGCCLVAIPAIDDENTCLFA